jgi:putative flippase GtrA
LKRISSQGGAALMPEGTIFQRLFVKKSDRLTVHLLRAILSSNISFALDFGLLVLLTEVVHLHYLISNGIGFMAGTTLLYVLSIYWVFNRRAIKSRHLEYWVFILIGVAGVGFNEIIIWVFTEKVHVFYLYSKVIAGCTVFFWNFISRRYIIFR